RDATADVITCVAGQALCNGACINPQTNPQFCGATADCGADGGSSGDVCSTSEACVMGACISCTSFPAATTFPVVGSQPFDLVSADLNGGGKRDIATANNGSGDVAMLLGTGTGTFNTPIRLMAGATPSGIVAADFNGDGQTDLVVSNASANT